MTTLLSLEHPYIVSAVLPIPGLFILPVLDQLLNQKINERTVSIMNNAISMPSIMDLNEEKKE